MTTPQTSATQPGIHPAIHYWRKGEARQNFGDFLSWYLATKILGRPRVEATVYHLLGSEISEHNFRLDIRRGPVPARATVAYWCCGMRDTQPIPARMRRASLFFGARGPLTARALQLPSGTVLGDPGLLLPLLLAGRPHEARLEPVCVPHVLDPIADDALARRTGVTTILRPEVEATETALEAFIERLTGASFVLAGSLHAAIVAAAYGIPFAFLDTGFVDIPFKWQDFAASVSIDPVFVQTLDAGQDLYHGRHAKSLRLPPLRPILDVCPFAVRLPTLVQAAARDGGWPADRTAALMEALDGLASPDTAGSGWDPGSGSELPSSSGSQGLGPTIGRAIGRLLGR